MTENLCFYDMGAWLPFTLWHTHPQEANAGSNLAKHIHNRLHVWEEREKGVGWVGVSCAVFVCVCILTWQQQQQQLEALTSFARSNLEVIFSFVMRRKKREKRERERERSSLFFIFFCYIFLGPLASAQKTPRQRKTKEAFAAAKDKKIPRVCCSKICHWLEIRDQH